MREILDKFFHSNDWLWRLGRTIVQGIFAVIIKALASGTFNVQDLIIPIVMCILSPIMAEMGKTKQVTEEK